MIITKEQLEKRVSSENNVLNKVEEEVSKEVIIKDGQNHLGRPGVKNLTHDERVAIGVLANTVGDKTAAELMGVAVGTAHNLRTGHRNTSSTNDNVKDMSLVNAIEARLESTKLSIQEAAAVRLLKAFDCITDEKLENASLKEVASVAGQMSQVLRNVTTQKKEEGGGTNVRIILHQPKPTREEHFEVIEVEAR